MTDYWGVALAGFATGLGVIFAQKLVNWLERHPIVIRMKRTADEFTRAKRPPAR